MALAWNITAPRAAVDLVLVWHHRSTTHKYVYTQLSCSHSCGAKGRPCSGSYFILLVRRLDTQTLRRLSRWWRTAGPVPGNTKIHRQTNTSAASSLPEKKKIIINNSTVCLHQVTIKELNRKFRSFFFTSVHHKYINVQWSVLPKTLILQSQKIKKIKKDNKSSQSYVGLPLRMGITTCGIMQQ